MVTADGTLVEPVLTDPVSARASGDESDCPLPGAAKGNRIPLEQALPAGRWVARIGYYTSAESFVDLVAGDEAAGFAVTPGLHVVYVDVDGALDGVHLTLADAGTLCVTNVDVGVPAGAVR